MKIPRALEQFKRLERIRPNDPAGAAIMAAVQRRQGKWAEAFGSFRRAVQLDPGNFNYSWDLMCLLAAGRRFDEARSERRRLIGRLPDQLSERFELAYLAFMADGATGEVEQFFRGLPADQANAGQVVALRKFWAIRHGDLAEAVRLDREHSDAELLGLPWRWAIEMAAVFAAQGDAAAVRERLKDFPATLRAEIDRKPDRSELWATLGRMEALLGNESDALRCARRAVELSSASRDVYLASRNRAALAFVESWVGRKDAAIANYAQLLQTPYGHWALLSAPLSLSTIHVMKRDPHFAPLRGDPQFEALLSDPKNNAPLF